MNCKKCGSPLTAEDKFCRNCGAAVNEQSAQLSQNLSNNNRFIFENQSNNNMAMLNNVGNYAQPINNSNNMNYGNSKNNNSVRNIIFIVAGILVIIIIVVLAVIAIMKFRVKDNNTNTPNSGSNSNSPTGIPTTNSSSSYKVVYNNFTFTIPDTMDYEISDNNLLIGDFDNTWVIQMAIFNGNYNILKSNRYELQNSFSKEGITANSPEVKTLGGHEYLTFELSTIGDQALGAYTKINSTNIAWIVVNSQNNPYDYSVLEKITPIITSAKYGNNTSNMEGTNNFDIDINQMIELAQ